MSANQQSIQAFDQQAAAYQQFFMDLDLYNDTYDAFCNLVPERHARLLELGCGPGNITRYLLQKRPDLKIEATDAAPAMVKLAQANNPGAVCRLLDCRELANVPQTYRGIIAGFCTPYLNRAECENFIKDAAGLLPPGGIFYLSTLEGNYENSGIESSSNGKYHAHVYYYPETELQAFFTAHHLQVLQVFRKQLPKADGTTGTHLILLARKNSA